MSTLLLLLAACTPSGGPPAGDTDVTGAGVLGLVGDHVSSGWLQSRAPPSATPCERDRARLGATLYTSLQAAVDAAGTGETITVCDGIFHERLRLTRDVVLESEHGLGFTFLVGDGHGSVISIAGASVTLTGLDITGGDGDPWRDADGVPWTVGGGIIAVDAPLLRLSQVRLHHHDADLGGGLFTAAVERVELVGVELTANRASVRGGGAWLADGQVAAEDLWVRLGEAPDGAGLSLASTTAALSDLRIEDNVATGDGGGLSVTDTALVLQRSTVVRNSADYGAGLQIQGGSLAADADTLFQDNLGGTSGGAIFSRDAALTLSGSQLVDNQADHGGGAYVLGGSAVLDGARVAGNHGYRGGGLYVTAESRLTLLGDTAIEANSADAWAGGLALVGGSEVDASDTRIAENHAPYGAGGLASEASCRLSAGTVLEDNVASSSGGGLYLSEARLDGTGLEVRGNQAPAGGGLVLEIDAEYLGKGDRIWENRADTGAGLLLYRAAIARLEDVEVSGNVATDQGGGALILVDATSLSCLDCDWGSGDADNGPEDIVLVDATFAAPPTFTCDAAGCRGS